MKKELNNEHSLLCICPRTNAIVYLDEDLIVYLELLYVLINHYSYVKNEKKDRSNPI